MKSGASSVSPRSRHLAGLHRLVMRMLSGFLCSCCALSVGAQAQQVKPDRESIRIGFVSSFFKNQNEADIVAAMKVWAATLADERGIRVDPDVQVYGSRSTAEEAVRDRRVDALTLLLEEYAGFPRDLVSGPFFRDEVDGQTHEEFVLLSRKDRDLSALKDMQGGKLGIHDNRSAGLASAWLDAQSAHAGLAAAGELFASVESKSKLSAVVLGVFFGQHDAGLVSRGGFLSMAELNPQVAEQLRIVKASPPIIPGVFCFRKDLVSTQKERFLREVLRLHESVVGAQVLRVFKSDHMAEVTDDQVDRSVALLNEWKAAGAEARTASLEERGDDP